MNKVFIKVAAAALTLAAAGYGAYKLYQKYCGAKIAKQNKFRNRFEDMSCNFDDDEYLEDDDVYYFGQSAECSPADLDATAAVEEELPEAEEEPADEEPEAENAEEITETPAQPLEDATIDDILGSSAE